MHGRNPFYAFFSLVLFGSLFLATGAIGWTPVRGAEVFVGRGRWVDGPIWSQIWMGLACLAGAAVAYRLASRDARLRRR